ncbi:hypothetical protein [Sphingomonas sp.]|uniref:hypothetical protein n=1 Tax=Sphingomonas sp. TaxID=28214 RepID=UPI003B3AEBCA
MTDKQPVQADGGTSRPDTRQGDSGRGGGGDSGGGAYPNPHSGKTEHPSDGVLGHGGQTEIGYHGPGKLGDQKVDEDAAPDGTADTATPARRE